MAIELAWAQISGWGERQGTSLQSSTSNTPTAAGLRFIIFDGASTALMIVYQAPVRRGQPSRQSHVYGQDV
jgi:hypothetical protein